MAGVSEINPLGKEKYFSFLLNAVTGQFVIATVWLEEKHWWQWVIFCQEMEDCLISRKVLG